MKNKVFINSDSFGKNSRYKWNKIANQFPGLEPVFLEPQFLSAAIKNYIQTSDDLLIGGGDGTLHHAVNEFTELDFSRIRIGLFGLGSSCSFLKSFPTSNYINDIPVVCVPNGEFRTDLGRVKFKNSTGEWQSKYFVANGSIGFLALANLIFNEEPGITKELKKVSTDAANNFVFLKSLYRYQPIPIAINDKLPANYLNIQFLKAKYYAGDFFFDRQNSLDSGLIDFHLIEYQGKMNTMNVFYQLMTKNVYLGNSHTDYRGKSIMIKSVDQIPLELDGEVYFGSEFHIDCVPRKLKLLG